MNAMLALVSASDTRVSGRLLLAPPPRWLRTWMLWATRAGDGWLWLAVALALATRADHGLPVLAAGALAAALSSLVLVTLKRRFRRPRPCEALQGLLAACAVEAPRWGAFDRWSFPSGHSMNAFAVGSVLALAFPWLLAPILLVAASIAASRVVLGLHFLSDVVVGSLLGALLGLGTFLVVLA
jgi:undecaprenyl-diphosphatase